MPELPEVETVRAQLAGCLPGETITAAVVLDPRLVAPVDPAQFAAALVGRTVRDLRRRGKFLLVGLDDGDDLVVHLRMTGRLHWSPGPPEGDGRFRRAVIGFGDGGHLEMSDQRRFGTMALLPAGTPDPWHGRVGVEPLGPAFTARRLGDLLSGRRAPVKALLLDQRLVAGIGNIYADEALFQAGIHPERPGGALGGAEVRRLHRAIRDRLRAGIDNGGASIDSYRDTLGRRGSMQDVLRVHLHAGDPCPRCGRPIEKIRVAQRGTYLCPGCQPR